MLVKIAMLGVLGQFAPVTPCLRAHTVPSPVLRVFVRKLQQSLRVGAVSRLKGGGAEVSRAGPALRCSSFSSLQVMCWQRHSPASCNHIHLQTCRGNCACHRSHNVNSQEAGNPGGSGPPVFHGPFMWQSTVTTVMLAVALNQSAPSHTTHRRGVTSRPGQQAVQVSCSTVPACPGYTSINKTLPTSRAD
jgi:hypothetical protein